MAKKKNYTKSAMRAYEKAIANLQMAQRKSFKFLKSTVKAFETRLNRIKTGTATKADVNYLKQFSTESKAIKKARSYVSDEGRKMSVAQGKLIERRKVQTLRHQTIVNVNEIKKVLESYPDYMMGANNQEVVLTEKNDIISKLDDFVDMRKRDMTTKEMEYLLNLAGDLQWITYQDKANNIFRYMRLYINNLIDSDSSVTVVQDDELSTIGTPYETGDEET